MTSIRVLALVSLLPLACGKKAPEKYQHGGSIKFAIDVPGGWKATPEKDDGGAKSVVIRDEFTGPDILIQWVPGQSYDQALADQNAYQKRLGDVLVSEKSDLNGRGAYVAYSKGGGEYAKSVVRCGNLGLRCMATINANTEVGLKNQLYDACKSLSCP
jgi:hypothetical protein